MSQDIVWVVQWLLLHLERFESIKLNVFSRINNITDIAGNTFTFNKSLPPVGFGKRFTFSVQLILTYVITPLSSIHISKNKRRNPLHATPSLRGVEFFRHGKKTRERGRIVRLISSLAYVYM